nr:hypothetical protein [uncultured Draconibacterium sp.]
MKQTLFILILFLVLFSCTSRDEKESKIKKSNSYKIDYINAQITLPDNYHAIKLDSLREFILSNNKNSIVQNNLLSTFNQLLSANSDYSIFADENYIENVVWLMKGEYVQLNNNIANQYIAMLEQHILSSWTAQGGKGTVLEKKIIKSHTYFTIKVKFKQESNGISKYVTQYVTTMNKSTFMVFVSNYENVDYEEWIKKTKSI